MINKFLLENKMNGKCVTVNSTNNVVEYNKLLCIGHISTDIKRNLNKFSKFYCKNLTIKAFLTPIKVGDISKVKDPISKSLKSFVVCTIVFPGYSACYIG